MSDKEKSKVKDFLDKKEQEGAMWRKMMDNYELSIAPKMRLWGEKMFFIFFVASFIFYGWGIDTSLFFIPINFELTVFGMMAGLVLQIRARQVLRNNHTVSKSSDVDTETAKSTMEVMMEGTEFEGVDEEVEEMIKQEEEEEEQGSED